MLQSILDTVLPHGGATLLLRHGHRAPFAPGDLGTEAELTEEGRQASYQLGVQLRSYSINSVVSSPLRRCTTTASEIVRGANMMLPIKVDSRLGDPGPFVADPHLAGEVFAQAAPLTVAVRQLSDEAPLPGFRPTVQGVALLLDLIVPVSQAPQGLSILISHDIILAVAIGHLTGTRDIAQIAPDFLEGALFWCRGQDQIVFWRGTAYHFA